MLFTLVLSFLLSAIGLLVYLAYFRNRLSLPGRKWFLSAMVLASIAFPFGMKWQYAVIPVSQQEYAQAIAKYTHEINVVDIQDPVLQDCYQHLQPGQKMCDCEVKQKLDYVVFTPNPLYETLIKAGGLAFWLFLFIASLIAIDLLIKIGYLWYLSLTAPRIQLTGLPEGVVLLNPTTPYPISSFSLFRNYIIWPSSVAQLPEEEQRLIMMHELAHLRNKDTWMQILLNTLKVVWWLNPVFYYIKNELVLISELIADQDAIQKSGTTAKSYAMLLLRLKEQQMFLPAQSFGGHFLKQRVMGILHHHEPRHSNYKHILMIGICAFFWSASMLILPSVERYQKTLNEYETISGEAAKSGKPYFCKSCLLDQLKASSDFGTEPKGEK